jgi:hypothetical protein
LNIWKASALGVAVGIIVSMGLIVLIPASDNYDLQNPYWNGMTTLRSEFRITPLTNLSSLAEQLPFASNDALLVIGPTLTYSQSDANLIRSFANAGGLVVIADDFGSGNQLLGLIGLKSRFAGPLLVDPLYNIKAEQLPIITQVYLPGVHQLAFDYATYLNVSDPSSQVLAYSSPFSFADLQQTGRYVNTDPLGPFPVVASIHLGRGRIVLISDSSLYLNAMIDQTDNLASFATILGGRQPFIDTSHWAYSGTTQAKQLLVYAYDVASSLDLKYAIIVAAGLFVTLIKVGTKSASLPVESAEKLSRLHPDWDGRELQRLAKERSLRPTS